MNSLTIIGNVTRTPETASTQTGKRVCNFTVAVNRRGGGQEGADYFRVTAWEQLGDNCARYLDKGRKVAVRGSVSARAYIAGDGTPRANLEITAQEVEFLSSKQDAAPVEEQQENAPDQGFTAVDDGDLPF